MGFVLKKYIFLFLFSYSCLSAIGLYAQEGSKGAFSILRVPPSAPVAALGQSFVSIRDSNLSCAVANPSLLHSTLDGQSLVSYAYLFEGIQMGMVSYARSFNGRDCFSGSLQYVNYGSFDRTDIYDQHHGTFYVADYLLSLGWGRMLEPNMYMGVNVKPIYSNHESYHAFSFAFDIAFSYFLEKKGTAFTLMARNFGYQPIPMHHTREKLPFSLDLGFSKKLLHAPITFFGTITHLNRWDLRYHDPLNPRETVDPFSGVVSKEAEWQGVLDNLFRHFDAGLLFQPSKLFDLSVGYSWKRKQEMQIDGFSLAGLSCGFSIYLKKFRLSYARTEYHKHGAVNQFTLSFKI